MSSTNATYLKGAAVRGGGAAEQGAAGGETEVRFDPRWRAAESACFHGRVGPDPAVRQLVEQVERVASANVLVTVLMGIRGMEAAGIEPAPDGAKLPAESRPYLATARNDLESRSRRIPCSPAPFQPIPRSHAT
ncbi:hypothetical protein DB31_8718 [Hyalangium minutum]|uniref:Uncharacterized protein n=1 Tax=Hyalangium minutum TaxID=394096 RepID=A0A085WI52_9BACT|nr:hypothetical protein DB31_8631 [Hyalangium minutum]KFE67365.1 hypothetical protein DB31_8718 [Hyalangium minutum]